MIQPEQLGRLEQLKADFKIMHGIHFSNAQMQWIYKYIEDSYSLGYNANFRETSPCTLPNSTHEKALVRVVEKHERIYEKGEFVKLLEGDFIQVLCGCGHIISEAEIKSK